MFKTYTPPSFYLPSGLTLGRTSAVIRKICLCEHYWRSFILFASRSLLLFTFKSQGGKNKTPFCFGWWSFCSCVLVCLKTSCFYSRDLKTYLSLLLFYQYRVNLDAIIQQYSLSTLKGTVLSTTASLQIRTTHHSPSFLCSSANSHHEIPRDFQLTS